MELARAKALVGQLLAEHKIDPGHGLDHALTVLGHAEQALKHVDLDPSTVLAVQLAALLHDVDDRKFFNSEGLENAQRICDQVKPSLTPLVLRMIDLVSCSKNGNTVVEPSWLLIPRWADRLEAIGRIGIYRCYVYTIHTGRPLVLPESELPKCKEDLDRLADPKRFAGYVQLKGKVGSSSFIDHFYDKILHICTIPTDNPYFLEQAALRKQQIIDFLLAFDPNDPLKTLQPIIQEFQL